MLRKGIILLVLFSFLFSSFLSYSFVYARGASFSAGIIKVPGVDCGNADSQNIDSRKCCESQIVVTPPSSLDSILSRIPFIGDFLDKILQMQRDISPIACVNGFPSPDKNDPNCVCVSSLNITPSPVEGSKELCEAYLLGTNEEQSCLDCAQGGGVWTTIGCVYGDVGRFITETLLGLGVSFAGIISLLCLLYGAFLMQTSRGDAERIQKARDMITSCLIGLILVIFSVFILKVIGIDILRIPGFGT